MTIEQKKSKKKFYNSLFQFKQLLKNDGWEIKKWAITHPSISLHIFKSTPTRANEPAEIEAKVIYDGSWHTMEKEVKMRT